VEGNQSGKIDAVTEGALQQEILRQLPIGGIAAFHLTDLLD
jgi:hypothetical protein